MIVTLIGSWTSMKYIYDNKLIPQSQWSQINYYNTVVKDYLDAN
jgi:hypothetical protein